MQFILDWLFLMVALVLDIFQGNPQEREDTRPYVMNEDMLHTAFHSMTSAYMTEDMDTRSDESNKVFEDALDRAMVRYVDGKCYASFGGSTGDIMDALQSAPLFPTRVCGDAGCCMLSSGIVGAYNAGYAGEFESALEECYGRCDGGCDVVVTGFSQGGAIAAAAAVTLAKYNPILITFAQHPVAWFGCDVLANMETYLRFTATCAQGGEPAYDSITYYGNPFFMRHHGTMIMMGEGGATTVGHNTGKTFMPITDKCHDKNTPYRSSLGLLKPGALDGFLGGSMCTTDIECKSRQCSGKRCV